jgi:hypothetical protein
MSKSESDLTWIVSIILLNFSFLAFREDSCILWFVNELNLNVKWLRDFIRFHSNSVGALRQVFIVSQSIKPILAFWDYISILIVGCETM